MVIEGPIYECSNTMKPAPMLNSLKDEKVAKRYAKKFEKNYDTVKIDKVFNKRRLITGYLVTCKGKKADQAILPDNVIELSQYLKRKSISSAHGLVLTENK